MTMVEITVSQLGERLGITRRRALELLRTEVVAGRQLANGIWLADGDSVLRYEVTAARGSGRTLDAATAWGLLWELSGLEADWLSASTRARVRRRIKDLSGPEIVSAVARRTKAHRYTAANADLAASGLIRTGRAAIDLIDTELIEDHRDVCGYVCSGNVPDYARSHFMAARTNGRDVLYENTLPVRYDEAAMPPAVIAADLATGADTRERSAGLRVIEELRRRWLASR